MVYKVIGLMSGSSLDGLDIAYVHLQEMVGNTGTADRRNRKWEYSFQHTASYPYTSAWKQRLASAGALSARDYCLLHVEYGRYLGQQVQAFISEFGLDYQVQLIASHGHTVFHLPELSMTAQLGDGAALAAETSINVVNDLRAVDVALGGQGAPIVPIGEQLLFQGYDLFLNLGGIANISKTGADGVFEAWDVCPANRVLNELAGMLEKDYDEGGMLAGSGNVVDSLLEELNALAYYAQPAPKSLANEFGTEVVLPMVKAVIETGRVSVEDGLRTYVEHIVHQISKAVAGLVSAGMKVLVTGGGAHNGFLVGRLTAVLGVKGIEVVVPDAQVIDFKEALVMALIGVFRWREESNVLASVTGAGRDSVGGAVYLGGI